MNSLLHHWWFKGGLIVLGSLLASLLVNKFTHWSWTWGKPVARPDVTLYGPNDHAIKDPSGLRMTLPADFSVQSQALPLPIEDERVIVKCKRDWEATGTPGGKLPAWMKISVANQPPDEPLAELAKKKKPDEGDPKQIGGVEDCQVDGCPAVRMVFEMRYHQHDFVREVTVVRRGGEVFFLRCQYVKGDKSDIREQMRDAVANAHLRP
jgi:hypothetical protein